MTKSLSDGLAVNVVYLDFLKAFDMVPHKRLLHKLSGFGLKKRVGKLVWVLFVRS